MIIVRYNARMTPTYIDRNIIILFAHILYTIATHSDFNRGRWIKLCTAPITMHNCSYYIIVLGIFSI